MTMLSALNRWRDIPESRSARTLPHAMPPGVPHDPIRLLVNTPQPVHKKPLDKRPLDKQPFSEQSLIEQPLTLIEQPEAAQL